MKTFYSSLQKNKSGLAVGESAREKLDGYTYADYLQWDNGKRWELIEGTIVKKKSKNKQIPIDDGFLMSPKNDFAFKLIFGDEKNKDLLIALLSAILSVPKEGIFA